MSKRYNLTFLVLFLALIIISVLHINNGVFTLNLSPIFNSIFNYTEQNQTLLIFREIRIPRTFIALFAGVGLAISGLLLQTFLRNPLAGPSVLGITSGSSLFVALSLLSGFSFFHSEIGITMSALIGAVIFSLIILLFSAVIQSQVSLLLVGIMLSAFTNSLIQIIQLSSNAENLKTFTLWSFGSLQQLTFEQIPFICVLFFIACIGLLFLIKPLNLLILGEKDAKNLGLNIQLFRMLIILISSLFAGLITAFCGPISFIGLAVPNITKIIFKTQNHKTLLVGSFLIGALTLLFCDLILIYLEPYLLIPLNAITSLIGAPVVVWIILKKF